MDLCSNGHGEVCYDSRNCPACELHADDQKTIDGLQEENDNLRLQVEDLNDEVLELKTALNISE